MVFSNIPWTPMSNLHTFIAENYPNYKIFYEDYIHLNTNTPPPCHPRGFSSSLAPANDSSLPLDHLLKYIYKNIIYGVHYLSPWAGAEPMRAGADYPRTLKIGKGRKNREEKEGKGKEKREKRKRKEGERRKNGRKRENEGKTERKGKNKEREEEKGKRKGKRKKRKERGCFNSNNDKNFA